MAKLALLVAPRHLAPRAVPAAVCLLLALTAPLAMYAPPPVAVRGSHISASARASTAAVIGHLLGIAAAVAAARQAVVAPLAAPPPPPGRDRRRPRGRRSKHPGQHSAHRA